MNSGRHGSAAFGLCLACVALAACESTPLTHGAIVRSQLAQAVQAQSRRCDDVVAYAGDGLLDYRVKCEAGQVYRVRMGANGRIDVTALDASRAPELEPGAGQTAVPPAGR